MEDFLRDTTGVVKSIDVTAPKSLQDDTSRLCAAWRLVVYESIGMVALFLKEALHVYRSHDLVSLALHVEKGFNP